MAVVLSGLVMAATLTACSSTSTATSTTPAVSNASNKSTIPASAFKDYTGITSTSVAVGNVSTLFAGLFKGAAVGTQAYADYVNSSGGVNGRKITVDGGDDNYSGAPNKQLTQADIQKDFAMVGGFSLQDNFGGTVLAAHPEVPNVTVSLDLATSNLPNSFSPAPA
ncbi:MAG TPA: ABC transporter substrate-binding protein, partial [Acidimicrobiales bacterium]|nr:ABC transporter substrate-binding protein [Acidimicrobiales bacterium]